MMIQMYGESPKNTKNCVPVLFFLLFMCVKQKLEITNFVSFLNYNLLGIISLNNIHL